MSDQFRLVTRSDFDGLVCAVLLKERGLVDEIQFVHPKDMQDGRIEITARDITTNLPYVASAHLVFDHHLSEMLRNETRPDNHVIDPNAPSAARVVYDYYGGRSVFGDSFDEMMIAVDQADSAQYELEDILRPSGWTLLNFLMDARTGLGRFREFRISNYQLMMQLIGDCRTHSIEQILELPDVKERVDLFQQHAASFEEQLKRCTTVYGGVVVVDLREEDTIWPGNRFMVYALYPEAQVSIHLLWGKDKQNTVLAVGKSILNRSSQSNLGALCLEYEGGGHRNAGTCQVSHENAKRVLGELIEKLNASA